MSAFSRKINFSPARNRQSLPPHSRRIQTIKGLRTQPTAGSVPARRKRLLRKPNLRSPPLPATDSPHGGPDRQPPQLLPQPPQPETSETRPASEVVRFSPNEGKRDYSVLFGNVTTRIPLRRKDLRESRHYRHGLRPRTNDRRMTDIEIYDCRGNPSFSGTGSKQKTNPPINRRFSVFNGPFRRREQNRPLWYIRTILRSISGVKNTSFRERVRNPAAGSLCKPSFQHLEPPIPPSGRIDPYGIFERFYGIFQALKITLPGKGPATPRPDSLAKPYFSPLDSSSHCRR